MKTKRMVTFAVAIAVLLCAIAPVAGLAEEQTYSQNIDATTTPTTVRQDSDTATRAQQDVVTTTPQQNTTTSATATPVSATVTSSSGQDTSSLLDGSYDTSVQLLAGESLTVASVDGSLIGNLYVRFYSIPGTWTLRYTDSTGAQHQQPCGQNGFLHEYVTLEGTGATAVEMSFPNGAAICTLDVYTAGSAPAGVQAWSPPCTQADLLVCSTHADDEILWLGGVLATYAGGQGLSAEVAYMCNYWDGDIKREHEKLDGLWTIGVRNYPVNAPFGDTYADSLESAREIYDQNAVSEFYTEQIRRFKPLVVVCQDFDGEYGHGGHILMAQAVKDAVDNSSIASFFPASAQTYGVWDVPKTYYHLYDQNRITLDLRQPIANLGGMTAVEAANEAYKQHVTQAYTWFYVSDDPNDPLADQINCAEFGLYRSTVGLDATPNMLEHIVPYEQQAAQAQQQSAAAAAQERAQANQQSASETTVIADVDRHNDGFKLPIIPLVIAAGVLLVILVVSLLLLRR